MKVALTVGDFLERAETVYGDRVAVVDEPGTPGSFGRRTYRELAASARGMAVALDGMGVPPASGWPWCRPMRPLLISVLRGERLRACARPHQFPAHRRGDLLHRRAFGLDVLLIDPEYTGVLGAVSCKRSARPRRRRRRGALREPGPNSARPASSRRGRDLHDQLHLGDHGSAQGRAADPPQLLAQCLDLRVAHHGDRSGRAVAHPADVPLQRLGDAVRGDRHGWTSRRAAQGRRRGHPDSHRARGGHRALRGPCGGRGHLRRGRCPRARRTPGARCGQVRIVVAGAPPPSAIIAPGRLGWEFIQIYGLTETSPLLTINRARGEWDDLDGAERARLLGRAGVPAVGVGIATTRAAR